MERRRHHRYALTRRVWCEGEGFTLHARALNLSLGGLFVRAASPPPTGRRLRISFRGDGEPSEVVANAEVAWVRQAPSPGMGLRIVGFERGREEFEHYVHGQRADAGDGEPEEPGES